MSIRARLLMLVLVVTVLSALFIAKRFVQERDQDVAAVTQKLPAVASAAAAALDERIRGTEQLHFGLARAQDLNTADRAACSAFLSKVRNKYPQYTGILTILPDGRLFCDSLESGRELDLRDRDYFQRALVSRDSISLQAAFGRLSGRAVLQVAYPVREPSGSLKFVLLASVDLQALVQSALRNALLPGAQVLFVQRSGLVLAASGNAVPRAGMSLSGTPLLDFAVRAAVGITSEFTDRDGTTQMWASAEPQASGEAGIVVLVGYPKKLLAQPADRRFAEDIGILVAAALLTFLGVWIFAEKAIRRPLATIADMIGKLGTGETGARIAPPYPNGELGSLMKSLNQTAQAQEVQRADLVELHGHLHAAQRLESIGQLTGGVAHDFNNLLTVILGNAEVLQEELRGNTRLEPLAAMMLDAAERGAELTQRLLAFARKQPLQPRAVDVNSLVQGMEGLLRRTIGENIEVRFSPAADLWLANVDPAQLDNALLNLCINSRDAMPQGGRLTIETANVTLTADYAGRNTEVRAGEYVMLAVSDNGIGIDAQIIGRVFEPFFTTKERGKGTGLGLSMTHGFVKQSGGHVALYSEKGQGTTVKLYLPRVTAGSAPAQAPTAGLRAAGGSETILLVEDDAMVRRYARSQLESLGYTVTEADDGVRALGIIRDQVAIDLLFTDIVMPNMNGRELVREALKHRPALKVLYTSGYTEDALAHQGRIEPGVHLLSKPYRREDLDRSIRAALGAHVT